MQQTFLRAGEILQQNQTRKTFTHLKNCISEKKRLCYATNQGILSAQNCFNFEKSAQETSRSV